MFAPTDLVGSLETRHSHNPPPEAVFAIVADHARYDRFDGIRRAKLVQPGDPDPNGLGARRRQARSPRPTRSAAP